MPKQPSNEWTECDITSTKPLDQVLREGDGIQLELFSDHQEEEEKSKLHKLVRKLYE